MSQPLLETHNQQRTPTVLVVEPAPAMARLLRTMMETLGFRVIEACGPDQALTEIESPTEIDLVLSELSLPDVSGPKLASFISKRRPSIPVVLLCDQRVPDTIIPADYAVYLNKPFTSDELADVIHRVAANTAP